MMVQENSLQEWDNGFFFTEPMMADLYDSASASASIFNNFGLNSSFGSVPTMAMTSTPSGLPSSSSFFTSPFTFPNSNNPFSLNTSPRFNTSPRQFQQTPFNPFNTSGSSPRFNTSPRLLQQAPFNLSASTSFPPPMFFQQEEPALPFDQTPLTPWMELPPGPSMRVPSPPPMPQIAPPHQPQPCEVPETESELDDSPAPSNSTSTSTSTSPSPSAGIVKPGQPLVTVFRKFHTNTNGPKPPRAPRKPRTFPSSKNITGDASITSDPSSPAIVIVRPKKRKEGRSISQRVIWTEELHQLFLQALEKLGVHTAMPKDILKLMNVKGLRRENISSHLQKYRLKLKEEEEGGNPSPMFKNIDREDSAPPMQDTAVDTSSTGCIPLPTYIFPRCNE